MWTMGLRNSSVPLSISKVGKAMKEKVTINDIASMCNVSKSSVSRYLNHGYVSKENGAKIQAAIDQTGFQSNFFASRIKRKNSHMIGIIVPSFAEYSVGKMLDGVLQTLSDQQYQGILLQSNGNFKQEEQCVQLFLQQGVDGILFLDSKFVENYRDVFKDEETKVIAVNQPCTYAPTISFDEKFAVSSVLTYAKEKQHQKLLYVMKDTHTSQVRKEWMEDMWNQDQLCITKVALHNDGIVDQAKEALRQKVDFIICDTDEVALCYMKYFSQMHIRVPHEISILSFSENPLYDVANPSLTHLEYDYKGFGSHLAYHMLGLIKEQTYEAKTSFIHLVEKDSVA